jgi:RNA polymerase sigma-70 factor (ECF subfamily)
VVQSVYVSFFQRQREGQFPALQDWDDLWGLLTAITLRKCLNRGRFHRQARRDVGREVPLGAAEDPGEVWEPADPAPTPLQAAILTETLEDLLGGLDARGRQIIELLLQGHTIEEVRLQVGCGERTVRRVRDRVKHKLQRQMGQAG